MTSFTVIYFLCLFALSYITTDILKKRFNLNLIKEITKKPKSFLLGGIIIFLSCILSSALSLLFSVLIGGLTSGLVSGILAVILFTAASLYLSYRYGNKLHGLIPAPLAVFAYLAVIICGEINDVGFGSYLILSLCNAFVLTVSYAIFGEIRDRRGDKAAPMPINRQIHPVRAQVMCSGTHSLTKGKYIYHGISDCFAAMSLSGGSKFCERGCLGCGSCVSACKFNSIVLIDGIAAVNTVKCTGCGVCVRACPKDLIKMIPRKARYWVGCSSVLRSAELCEQCRVGCTGCGLCKKGCPSGAISVIEHCAVIDQEKCTSCGKCAEICPRKSIWSLPVPSEMTADGPI